MYRCEALRTGLRRATARKQLSSEALPGRRFASLGADLSDRAEDWWNEVGWADAVRLGDGSGRSGRTLVRPRDLLCTDRLNDLRRLLPRIGAVRVRPYPLQPLFSQVQDTLRDWWVSPTGPATSIFWAPLAICGLVASGAYDAYYMGPEIINARMSATQVRGGIRLRSSACTVFREYGGCFAENPIKVMWGVSSLSDVLFSAEVVYSALFARFAWCVDPRSYTLLAGHVANITVRPGGHGDFVIKKAQNFMCSLW